MISSACPRESEPTAAASLVLGQPDNRDPAAGCAPQSTARAAAIARNAALAFSTRAISSATNAAASPDNTSTSTARSADRNATASDTTVNTAPSPATTFTSRSKRAHTDSMRTNNC